MDKKLTFPLSMSGLSVTILSNWVLVSQKYSGAKYSSINDLAKDKENMWCTQHHADKIITELHWIHWTRICETFIRIFFVYHEKSDFFILRLSIYQIPDGNSVLKVSMTFIPLLWTKRSHCLWWKDKFVMFLPSLCQVTNQWSLKNFFGRTSMVCWMDSNA